MWYDYDDRNGDGSNEIQIDFGQARTPVSLLLINNCVSEFQQSTQGSCHVRVGNESAAFSTSDPIAKTNIVDGGIFPLQPQSGKYITLRRDGANPRTNNALFMISQIKVYECPNLLKEYQGRVAITSDTSQSVSGFEPLNLLKNLENRSACGDLKAIETAAVWSAALEEADPGASRLTEETCF